MQPRNAPHRLTLAFVALSSPALMAQSAQAEEASSAMAVSYTHLTLPTN